MSKRSSKFRGGVKGDQNIPYTQFTWTPEELNRCGMKMQNTALLWQAFVAGHEGSLAALAGFVLPEEQCCLSAVFQELYEHSTRNMFSSMIRKFYSVLRGTEQDPCYYLYDACQRHGKLRTEDYTVDALYDRCQSIYQTIQSCGFSDEIVGAFREINLSVASLELMIENTDGAISFADTSGEDNELTADVSDETINLSNNSDLKANHSSDYIDPVVDTSDSSVDGVSRTMDPSNISILSAISSVSVCNDESSIEDNTGDGHSLTIDISGDGSRDDDHNTSADV